MTTSDKREEAFEGKFVHDEELRFKVTARRNKLLGNWAASQLGLTGEAALAYANELVTAHLENQKDEDTLRKVSEDLLQKGISAPEIAAKMDEFYHFASRQIQAEK